MSVLRPARARDAAQLHALAARAAEAARCAGLQGSGKYWRFHDALFSSQASLTEGSFRSIARQVGLDTTQYDRCIGSKATALQVRKDLEEAEKVGLQETPSFVVGRTSVDGQVTGA